MAKLGEYNDLKINRFVDFGAFLDDGEDGEILIPSKYLSGNEMEGDVINVFYYLDSEERPIATTEKAVATVGEFGVMEVAYANDYGAFMDWGLTKNLFVPFIEQHKELHIGEKHLVYVYLDELTYRLVGSTKVKKYIDHETTYEKGEEIDAIVYDHTPIGYKALINQESLGLIYKNEVFTKISIGDHIRAYIKQIREDGKIDLALQPQGYSHVEDFSDVLLQYIKDHKGKTSFNDKSSPEDIKETFGVSKKIFKKAIGKLYKSGSITIDENGIRLTS